MAQTRRIALIAHDSRKADLLEWATEHHEKLRRFALCSTGTTGALLTEKLSLTAQRYRSGPLGGDLEMGAQIVEGLVDLIVFFWDPLNMQPHDPDIRALLRIATLYNIPMACNRSTADFVIASPLLDQDYQRHSMNSIEEYQRSRLSLLQHPDT